MTYSEDFPPIKGDRVFFKDPQFKIIVYNIKGRIISVGEKEVSVLTGEYCKKYWSIKISDLKFLYPCPWYKFWQKY